MKKLLLLMLTISLGLIVVGCSNDTEEADDLDPENSIELTESEEGLLEDLEAMEEEIIEAEGNPQTFEGFKEAYKIVGYEVGESQEVDYERVYADDGIKFEVDGQILEIYKYDNAMDMSDEAENLILNHEGNPPVMFDGTNTVAETKYGDKYTGVYDVPGFLLLYGSDYGAPLQPTEPNKDRPDNVLSVFMGYSLMGSGTPTE